MARKAPIFSCHYFTNTIAPTSAFLLRGEVFNKTLFVYKPSFKGSKNGMFVLVLVYNINKQMIRTGAVEARMRSLESVLRSA